MASKSSFMLGLGTVSIVEDSGGVLLNGNFTDQQNIAINIEPNSIEYERGEFFKKVTAPTNRDISISFEVKGMNTSIREVLTGGSRSSTDVKRWIVKESATVPSAPGPYTVVLTNNVPTGTGADTAVLEVYDKTLDMYLERAAAAGSNVYAFDAATKTLTLNSSNADDELLISYTATGSSGSKIEIDGSDVPSPVHLVLCMRTATEERGGCLSFSSNYTVVSAKCCVLTEAGQSIPNSDWQTETMSFIVNGDFHICDNDTII